MNLLIDGGYLSFLLAYDINTYEYFVKERPYTQYLWLMDGGNNYRKVEYPEYKSNRRKNLSPEMIEIRTRVHHIRRIVERSYPKVYKHDNLEADDLIALFHHQFHDTQFVTFANDKDMLQIPHIKMIGGDRKGGIKHYQMSEFKSAKAIKGYLDRRAALLFYQTLLGDATDNIPRLLPNRAYSEMKEYYDSGVPFSEGYKVYGNKFLTNLSLVMLPHMRTLKTYSIDNLIKTLDMWYQTDNLSWVNELGIDSALSHKISSLYNMSYVDTDSVNIKGFTGAWEFLNDESDSGLNIIENVIKQFGIA